MRDADAYRLQRAQGQAHSLGMQRLRLARQLCGRVWRRASRATCSSFVLPPACAALRLDNQGLENPGPASDSMPALPVTRRNSTMAQTDHADNALLFKDAVA
jgi:hypothetical protein